MRGEVWAEPRTKEVSLTVEHTCPHPDPQLAGLSTVARKTQPRKATTPGVCQSTMSAELKGGEAGDLHGAWA